MLAAVGVAEYESLSSMYCLHSWIKWQRATIFCFFYCCMVVTGNDSNAEMTAPPP